MITESDTPRTDEAEAMTTETGDASSLSKCSRKLERELAEARKDSKRLHQIERLSEDGCLHIGTSTNEYSCVYRISIKGKIYSGRGIREAIDAAMQEAHK